MVPFTINTRPCDYIWQWLWIHIYFKPIKGNVYILYICFIIKNNVNNSPKLLVLMFMC